MSKEQEYEFLEKEHPFHDTYTEHCSKCWWEDAVLHQSRRDYEKSTSLLQKLKEALAIKPWDLLGK